ncbi:MAG: hypothetical protein Q8M07_02970 [Prosthecobacter sp.]|nr:hypothetical protein [Prosthecobacter sp.]
MSAVISITKRGTLTRPKEFWTLLGLLSSGRVIAQETKRGILLRPESIPASKTYSKAKGPALPKRRPRWHPSPLRCGPRCPVREAGANETRRV